jgi:hypothetical protein
MVEMGPSRDCLRCGETFLLGRLGRKAQYCSPLCRRKDHDRRILMTELAIELHRLLLQAALQRRLLLPLLRAASGDTSLTIPAENDNQNR